MSRVTWGSATACRPPPPENGEPPPPPSFCDGIVAGDDTDGDGLLDGEECDPGAKLEVTGLSVCTGNEDITTPQGLQDRLGCVDPEAADVFVVVDRLGTSLIIDQLCTATSGGECIQFSDPFLFINRPAADGGFGVIAHETNGGLTQSSNEVTKRGANEQLALVLLERPEDCGTTPECSKCGQFLGTSSRPGGPNDNLPVKVFTERIIIDVNCAINGGSETPDKPGATFPGSPVGHLQVTLKVIAHELAHAMGAERDFSNNLDGNHTRKDIMEPKLVFKSGKYNLGTDFNAGQASERCMNRASSFDPEIVCVAF